MRSGGVAVVCALLAGCGASGTADPPPAPPRVEPAPASVDDPIEPLQLSVPLDERKVALGERLFRDPILSPDGGAACTSCHELARGGVDGAPVSRLPGHPAMAVNTPTIFNVAYNFRFHWAGGYASLEDQLAVPITSPRALATTFEDVVARLRASATYASSFQAIYPEGVTVATFKDAMVAYERSLITPRAPLDRFLSGEAGALSPIALEGYELFKGLGCISCHQGVAVGGNMFQKLGVHRDFFGSRATLTDADLGRFNETRREEDRHVFRVPSLRNVALTGPWLHDGSATTLEEVVRLMAYHQLGLTLGEDQVERLVAFLGALSGEPAIRPAP